MLRGNVSSVHLHDAQALPALPARQGGPHRHLAVVLSRRKDRDAGLQRRREVDVAADHGRHRHRVQRPRPARSQRDGGHARAGAGARPRQGRQGQCRGRRRRDPRAARSLQRSVDELLRRDRRRVRARTGADRRRGRLEPRHHPRVRDGRAALPAARRRRDHALGRRAPPRGDVPAAAAPARPAAPRRAHQPPRRRVGGVAGAASARLPRHGRGHHPRSLLSGQRRRLDPGARPRPWHPLPGQLLRLAGAEAKAPLPGGTPGVQAVSARSSRNWSGCASMLPPAATSPRRA